MENKKETTDITLKEMDTKEVSQFVSADGKPMGLEEYEPASTFGWLRLDHKTGELEYTLTGERKKKWDVVIVNYSFGRTMFDKDIKVGNNMPLCKTMKPEKIREKLEGNTYGLCSQCEFSQWGENRTPPPCKEQITFTGFIEGAMATPVGIQLKSSSYGVGMRLLNSYFKAKRPLFTSILTVSASDLITRGSVEYRTWEITEKDILPEDMIKQFADEYMKHKDMPGMETAEELVDELVTKEADEKEMDALFDDKEKKDEKPF
jgi:hypothetical protein